ncbi:MAG: hypothetical protein IJ037_08780 [Clostridia bacterium]|nr:hypothetical protein [Clostridia bacterium]MBQ8368474.1 hypothetical protein [Clostridia bacterium]
MAKCYNCGIEIPADDKTRLCDRCKGILLPFVKLTDASTSSAVRRLISNERNLRNAGVTDSGMEYLLRICELRDKKKMQEKAEREAARNAKMQTPPQPQPDLTQDEDAGYMEIELPMDEPLALHREPYGKMLGVCAVLLILCGAGLIAYFAVQWLLHDALEIPCVIAAIACFAASGIVSPLKKVIHDLDEIKTRLR